MAGHTPGPWFSHRTNWRGEPEEHKIYISGDRHEVYDEDDNGDETDEVIGFTSTSIAIVEGNAGSRDVTKANARLVAVAPQLLAACQKFTTWDESPHASEEQAADLRRTMASVIAKATKKP